MRPDREEAQRLVRDAETYNPGPWGDHCRVAAACAQKIATAAGMDPEKAYVLALLHDIGRRYGKRHLGHAADGYSYMMRLGYDEVARVCLTHSFHENTCESYTGNFDTTKEEYELLESKIREIVFDEYDMLIQLCDCIAGSKGVVDIVDRLTDVESRYGKLPQQKWDYTMQLKQYFEERTGDSIYRICGKDDGKTEKPME